MKNQVKEGELSFEDLIQGSEFSVQVDSVDNVIEMEDETTEEDSVEDTTGDTEVEIEGTEPTTDSEEDNDINDTDTVDTTPPAEKKKEKTPAKPIQSDYLILAKKLIEKGKWDDAVIKDEDGNETPLSELESLDEETFFQIQENQDSFKKEDIETNYVSLKDVDEKRKKVANILLKGGDLKEIFKNEANLERYINPYKGIDLDNEETQAQVYYNFLVKQRGNDPEVAEIAVAKAKKDLTLDVKSKEIIEKTNQAFDNYVQKQEEALEQQKVEAENQEKEYRKALLKTAKEKNLKDPVARKYVDLATKRDKDGSYAIDSLYNSVMEDPDKALDLISFLENKDEYLKRYMDKAKTEVTKNSLKEIKIIRGREKSKTVNDTAPTEMQFEIQK